MAIAKKKSGWGRTLSKVLKEEGLGQFTDPTITSLLDDVLRSEQEADSDPRAELHISDLGKCPRRVWNRINQKAKPVPFDDATLFNFAFGRVFEDELRAKLNKHPEVATVKSEVEIALTIGGEEFEGHMDALVVWEAIDRIPQPVEIKSTSSKSMAFTLGQGTSKDDHKLQLGGYLCGIAQNPHQLGVVNADLIEYGSIVYGVKDAVKGEDPKFGEAIHIGDVIEDVEQAGRTLLDEVMSDNEPSIPQEYSKYKYPCGYCELSKYCYGG